MKKQSGTSWVLIVVLVFVAINIVISAASMLGGKPETNDIVPGDKNPQKAESKEDLAHKARVTSSRIAVASLKSALNDPDSLAVEQVLVSADATTVCMTYRAKNGFGGYIRNHMSMKDGRGSVDADDWNKRCAGKQFSDMTATVVR